MTERAQRAGGGLAGSQASVGLCTAWALVNRSCDNGNTRAAHPYTHSLCVSKGTKPHVLCRMPCIALRQHCLWLSVHTGECQFVVFRARRARRALLFGRHPSLGFVVLLLLAGFSPSGERPSFPAVHRQVLVWLFQDVML